MDVDAAVGEMDVMAVTVDATAVIMAVAAATVDAVAAIVAVAAATVDAVAAITAAVVVVTVDAAVTSPSATDSAEASAVDTMKDGKTP